MGSTNGDRLTAAGGVLWRTGRNGTEVLLVHRPGYDDWSLPKGKPDRGENALQTAVREVTEETGLPFTVGPRLGHVTYELKGRTKTVWYWSMQLDPAYSGHPHSVDVDEVDEFAWLPVAKASQVLTYPGDRQILRRFQAVGTVSISLLLVRHGRAGSRSKWHGPDCTRPLDGKGAKQAAALGSTVPAFGPDLIVAAPLTRCIQTAEPLALSTGLAIEEDDAISDAAYEADPQHIVDAITRFARSERRVVAVSQGITMRGVLDRLLAKHRDGHPTKKGGLWALGMADGKIAVADYYASLLPR